MEARAESLEGRVLRALIIEIKGSTKGLPLLKTITERAKAITGYDKLTSKKVGAILRTIGFQTKQDLSSRLYHVEVDEERLEGLKKRYGVMEDENVD